MADLAQFIAPAAVGTEVYGITGELSDMARATGYAAWVQGVTGSPPDVIQDGSRARLVMDAGQVTKMQAWLDQVTTKAPGRVVYELGPVLQPWIVKKATAPAIGIFFAGALSAYLLTRIF